MLESYPVWEAKSLLCSHGSPATHLPSHPPIQTSSLSPTHPPTHPLTHSPTHIHPGGPCAQVLCQPLGSTVMTLPGTNHQAPNLNWGSRQGSTHPGGCKEGDIGTSICMHLMSSHYYYFTKHFIFLFLVVLGICCCTWAFSKCGGQAQ